jgi:pimeloyl-ACP methyl ester carboxylesterase
MPRVRLTDLLVEVDSWTGFTRHFTHLKTGEPSKDLKPILAAILALGGYRPSEEKQRRVSEILSVARQRGTEAGVEAWMEDPFYPPAKDKPAARERVRQIARENLPRLLSTPGFREEPDPPTMEGLSRIVTPTLILVGERDDRDNREIACVLASRLPRSEKKIFSGCGHLVNFERPEEFYSVVADFLDAQGYPSEPSPR